MSTYKLIFTNIGLSKIQNAELTGDYVNIEKFAVGDGVISDLQPTMTGLLNEKYRTFINQVSTDAGKTNFDLVVPSEVGGFYIREVALYDVDDDCICIGTVPVTYKVNPSEGAAKAVHIRVSTATINVDTLQLSYDNSQVYATYLYANDHQNNKANPHEVTKAQVGLGNADNTADNAKNVLSATKLTTARTITLTGDVDGNTSFDGSANVSINVSLDIDGATDIGTNLADTDLIIVDKGANGTNRKSAISRIWTYISGKLTGAISTVLTTNLTASRALASDASGKVTVSTVTSTELGYVSGVTSAIQTQINSKQATITGAATTVVASNLTVNRALVSDASGKISASSITSTILGYLGNVSSDIQTQLNGKQPTLGFTPVQQGGGASQTANKIYLGWSSAGDKLRLQVDSVDFGSTFPIDIGGNAATATNAIGYNQTWQDVTASRALGVTYTNTSGKPIMVLICTVPAQNCGLELTIAGTITHAMSHNAPLGVSSNRAAIEFIVPNNVTYSVTADASILKWNELR